MPAQYPDDQYSALASAGYATGTLSDRWKAFWEAQYGTAGETLYDSAMGGLATLGYATGTFHDRLKAWCGGTGTLIDVWRVKLISGISSGDSKVLLETGDGILFETGDSMLKE